ncbi:MAG: hypothetical protein KJO96_09935, partial [Winogradskyella sp.]|nr:hypothetical protein [Winogradskyella sp.]
MTLIISYTALILAQISIYMYLRNDLNSIAFLNKFNSLFGINPDIKTENQVDSNNVHAEVPVVKIEKQQACT